MDYSDILKRLREATGPDRELDFWISVRLDPEGDLFTDDDYRADIAAYGIEGMAVDAPYTASIDSALSLVEKLLPDADWQCGYGKRVIANECAFAVLDYHKHKDEDRVAHAATPALAILIALFSALSSEAEG